MVTHLNNLWLLITHDYSFIQDRGVENGDALWCTGSLRFSPYDCFDRMNLEADVKNFFALPPKFIVSYMLRYFHSLCFSSAFCSIPQDKESCLSYELHALAGRWP
jgi:hypothetical protein